MIIKWKINAIYIWNFQLGTKSRRLRQRPSWHWRKQQNQNENYTNHTKKLRRKCWEQHTSDKHPGCIAHVINMCPGRMADDKSRYPPTCERKATIITARERTVVYKNKKCISYSGPRTNIRFDDGAGWSAIVIVFVMEVVIGFVVLLSRVLEMAMI